MSEEEKEQQKHAAKDKLEGCKDRITQLEWEVDNLDNEVKKLKQQVAVILSSITVHKKEGVNNEQV